MRSTTLLSSAAAFIAALAPYSSCLALPTVSPDALGSSNSNSNSGGGTVNSALRAQILKGTGHFTTSGLPNSVIVDDSAEFNGGSFTAPLIPPVSASSTTTTGNNVNINNNNNNVNNAHKVNLLSSSSSGGGSGGFGAENGIDARNRHLSSAISGLNNYNADTLAARPPLLPPLPLPHQQQQPSSQQLQYRPVAAGASTGSGIGSGGNPSAYVLPNANAYNGYGYGNGAAYYSNDAAYRNAATNAANANDNANWPSLLNRRRRAAANVGVGGSSSSSSSVGGSGSGSGTTAGAYRQIGFGTDSRPSMYPYGATKEVPALKGKQALDRQTFLLANTQP
jgi:hypothetical protein